METCANLWNNNGNPLFFFLKSEKEAVAASQEGAGEDKEDTVLGMQPGCTRALLFHRRSLRLFRVCLSVALLLEQLDLLLTGDLYVWIIDGGGVLDRSSRVVG